MHRITIGRRSVLKVVFYTLTIILMIPLLAYSQGFEVQSTFSPSPSLRSKDKKDLLKIPFHGDLKPVDPALMNRVIVDALKNRTLSFNTSKTIGEAFDSYQYSTKKIWREVHTVSGPYFVDCTLSFPVHPLSMLSFKEQLVVRKLEIKFAVHETGESYIAMITRFDTKTDGMIYTHRYSPLEIEQIVKAVYENREITF